MSKKQDLKCSTYHSTYNQIYIYLFKNVQSIIVNNDKFNLTKQTFRPLLNHF